MIRKFYFIVDVYVYAYIYIYYCYLHTVFIFESILTKYMYKII